MTDRENSEGISGYKLVSRVLERRPGDVKALIELAQVEDAKRTEWDWLEFKASMLIRPEDKKGKENDADGYWNVVEAIVAMLNTRGGAVLLGINDAGVSVGAFTLDPRKVFAEKGLEAYLRTEILNRIWPVNQGLNNNSFTWSTGNNAKWELSTSDWSSGRFKYEVVDFEGQKIVVILVPPIPKGDPCIIALHNGEDRLLHRTIGSVGQVEKMKGSKNFQDFQQSRSPMTPDLLTLWNKFIAEDEAKNAKQLEIKAPSTQRCINNILDNQANETHRHRLNFAPPLEFYKIIHEQILKNNGRYHLVTASRGMGKSAMMANFKGSSTSDVLILFHMKSGDLKDLSYVIQHHIHKITGKHEATFQDEVRIKDLLVELSRSVEKTDHPDGLPRQIILLLDGLDEWGDREMVRQFPSQLANNLTVVMTSRPDIPIVEVCQFELDCLELQFKEMSLENLVTVFNNLKEKQEDLSQLTHQDFEKIYNLSDQNWLIANMILKNAEPGNIDQTDIKQLFESVYMFRDKHLTKFSAHRNDGQVLFLLLAIYHEVGGMNREELELIMFGVKDNIDLNQLLEICSQYLDVSSSGWTQLFHKAFVETIKEKYLTKSKRMELDRWRLRLLTQWGYSEATSYADLEIEYMRPLMILQAHGCKPQGLVDQIWGLKRDFSLVLKLIQGGNEKLLLQLINILLEQTQNEFLIALKEIVSVGQYNWTEELRAKAILLPHLHNELKKRLKDKIDWSPHVGKPWLALMESTTSKGHVMKLDSPSKWRHYSVSEKTNNILVVVAPKENESFGKVLIYKARRRYQFSECCVLSAEALGIWTSEDYWTVMLENLEQVRFGFDGERKDNRQLPKALLEGGVDSVLEYSEKTSSMVDRVHGYLWIDQYYYRFFKKQEGNIGLGATGEQKAYHEALRNHSDFEFMSFRFIDEPKLKKVKLKASEIFSQLRKYGYHYLLDGHRCISYDKMMLCLNRAGFFSVINEKRSIIASFIDISDKRTGSYFDPIKNSKIDLSEGITCLDKNFVWIFQNNRFSESISGMSLDMALEIFLNKHPIEKYDNFTIKHISLIQQKFCYKKKSAEILTPDSKKENIMSPICWCRSNIPSDDFVKHGLLFYNHLLLALNRNIITFDRELQQYRILTSPEDKTISKDELNSQLTRDRISPRQKSSKMNILEIRVNFENETLIDQQLLPSQSLPLLGVENVHLQWIDNQVRLIENGNSYFQFMTPFSNEVILQDGCQLRLVGLAGAESYILREPSNGLKIRGNPKFSICPLCNHPLNDPDECRNCHTTFHALPGDSIEIWLEYNDQAFIQALSERANFNVLGFIKALEKRRKTIYPNAGFNVVGIDFEHAHRALVDHIFSWWNMDTPILATSFLLHFFGPDFDSRIKIVIFTLLRFFNDGHRNRRKKYFPNVLPQYSLSELVKIESLYQVNFLGLSNLLKRRLKTINNISKKFEFPTVLDSDFSPKLLAAFKNYVTYSSPGFFILLASVIKAHIPHLFFPFFGIYLLIS